MTGIDLHMHSACSNDGELSPAQLMTLCHTHQVHTVSITDHNSTGGIAEALLLAGGLGITLIPGIEIDCTYRETDLHLLGYGIFWQDPVFAELESTVGRKIMNVFPAMVENLTRLGIPVVAHPGANLAGKEDWVHELLDAGAFRFMQQYETYVNSCLYSIKTQDSHQFE
jgi:predicted metal-dependent phosphoesterase TrpH